MVFVKRRSRLACGGDWRWFTGFAYGPLHLWEGLLSKTNNPMPVEEYEATAIILRDESGNYEYECVNALLNAAAAELKD